LNIYFVTTVQWLTTSKCTNVIHVYECLYQALYSINETYTRTPALATVEFTFFPQFFPHIFIFSAVQ